MSGVRRRIGKRSLSLAWVGSALVACLTITLVRGAEAHGRFPEAGMVAVSPTNPQLLLVRTTYGLVSSSDGGAQWRWICPEAIAFDADKEDPAFVITANGAVAMGTLRGLRVGQDGGCEWASVGGELAKRYFIDVVLEADPSRLVALSSKVVSADSFEVNLWQSADNAESWAALGAEPPSDFGALTLAVCPSDPQRIYLSGRDGAAGQAGGEDSFQGVLMRSDDRGASWQRLAVAGADGVETLPYIAGVDPSNADRVYLANIKQQQGTPVFFELMLSHDGGKSWQSVLERSQAIGGFSISPDGAKVAVGGGLAGLWTADTAAPQFVKVNELPVKCLSWQNHGLYACAEETSKGFSLGLSVDSGVSFEPLMRRASPCGALECPSQSSVAAQCPALWPLEAQELGAPTDCGAGAGGGAPGPTEPSCGCQLPIGAKDQGTSPVQRVDRGPQWLVLQWLGLMALLRRRGSWRREDP